MAFSLPDLPYGKDALAPYLSQETLEFHHGKHHNAYVTNLNGLIEGSDHATQSLEEIILSAEGPLFNNAAQVWNHTFYWHCMKPGGGGEPSGELATAIARDFGSLDDFKKEFTAAAVGQFGSGWAWLILERGSSQGHQDRECRPAAQARAGRAPYRGRMGARLLHRLSEPASQVCGDFPEQPR